MKKVETQRDDLPEWCRRLAQAVNLLIDGKSNNTGSVTLTENVTTTTVTDRRIGDGSTITFCPETANAAAELTTMYVSTRTAGASFVLTHANNAQTDRIFKYTITG